MKMPAHPFCSPDGPSDASLSPGQPLAESGPPGPAALCADAETGSSPARTHLEKNMCVPLRPRLFSFAFYMELCNSSRNRAPMTRTTEPPFAAQRKSGANLLPALTSPSPFKHAEMKHPSGSFPKGWVGRGAFCCSQLLIYFHGSLPAPLSLPGNRSLDAALCSQAPSRGHAWPGHSPRLTRV